MTPEERAKVRRWTDIATEAAHEAARARDLFARSSQPDAAIDSGALVSIALSLSVIAEVVTLTLAEEAERG